MQFEFVYNGVFMVNCRGFMEFIKMKKRNTTKQGLIPNIILDEQNDHDDTDYANFQVKRNSTQHVRQSLVPNFASITTSPSFQETVNDQNPTTNAEYSYSYSYSSNSDVESNNPKPNESTPENPEMIEMNQIFEQLYQKFGEFQETDSANIKKQLQEAKQERQLLQNEMDEISEAIGPDSSNVIWAQKQFFADLIDFINTASSLKIKSDFSLSNVKPEYLSLDYSLERIKSFQRFDPELYKKVGFPDSVQDLFEFYAILETQSFSFVDNKPLIDLPWIRAGWRWTDEFGNPNTVPKVFESTCLPILVNKLQAETINTEQEFRFCFYHCLEICDFCIHPSVAENQLMGILKRRLEAAIKTGRISFDVFNKLSQEFGLTASLIPSEFV